MEINFKLLKICLYSVVFIGMFSFSGCCHQSNDPLYGFSAMEGKWTAYKGVHFCENWNINDDYSMNGLGLSISGKDTLFTENLLLISRNDLLFYRVETKSHNKPIEFILNKCNCREWEFVNEKNDFPQLITYHLKNDTLLDVKISNIRKTREQFFFLKRNNH